jgi:hypothetical protein
LARRGPDAQTKSNQTQQIQRKSHLHKSRQITKYQTSISHNSGITYLQAIDLPATDRQAVMQELAMMGVTAGALFPGIDGACESLREQNFSMIKTHAVASRAPVVKITP